MCFQLKGPSSGIKSKFKQTYILVKFVRTLAELTVELFNIR